MTSELNQHRKKASDLSLGSSHTVIYDKAISLLQNHKPIERHLDFGSGQGLFLRRLLECFSQSTLTGVDLMPKPQGVSNDIGWLQADLNAVLEIADDSYKTITALEIIEHLENPRHVFRELYRILQPGGVLILSTPNNESLRSLVSYFKRGHFVAFTDRNYPAHITPLNRQDLMRSAKEAGFEFLSFDYSGLGCLPGLTRFTWQGFSCGMLKGLRYSDNIFIVLQKK